MTVELYVYYKADRALAAQVREAVSRFAGVRLLLRDSENVAQQTWMEIHSGPDAAQTEQALAQAMADWGIGTRHVERFIPQP